jgi:hypothetical protein
MSSTLFTEWLDVHRNHESLEFCVCNLVSRWRVKNEMIFILSALNVQNAEARR